MNRNRALTIVASALAVPAILIAAAQVSPGAPGARVRGERAALVDQWRSAAGAAGTVVAVQHGQEHAWTDASGTALRHGQQPLTEASEFRVASITKTFVAVVVMQLVNEGRLVLDDTVSRYLPGSKLGDVTVRQLLNHTSGIPDYEAVDETFGPNLVRDRQRRWSPADLVAIATSVRREFPPGTGYAYSNTDYVVLGMVIQAATGKTWAQQVRRRIIDRLHLTRTYVDGAQTGQAPIAGYHDIDGDGDEENIETGAEWTSLATSEGPAGAIVSTAPDLTTFAGALFHGRLVDRAALRDMMTPGDSSLHPSNRNYGLGLEMTKPDLVTTTWGHGGFLPGFRSTLWYVPSRDLTVVVLANDSSANTEDLAELLVRASR